MKKNILFFTICTLTTNMSHTLDIIQTPSPNFNERRNKKNNKKITQPTHIILHYTTDCFADQSKRTLSSFFRPVSAHYLIAADGTISQLVDESKRAWHAGKSSWHNNKQINNYSIGIEIVNPGFSKTKKDPCTYNQNIWNKNTGVQIQGSPYYWYNFTDQQIKSVTELCKDIIKRYDIVPEFILGHSDIAPGRKVDPGPLFPWQQLAKNNVGVWYNSSKQESLQNNISIKQVQQMLKSWGYKIPTSGKMDKATKKVVRSFQMHFRPTNIDGIIDQETISILQKLTT